MCPIDMFSRRKITPLESEDLRRMGRLEAAVESLELKWVNYRDEIKKLVNRLEKREQRLEQKLAEGGKDTTNGNSGNPPEWESDVHRRIAARRGS